VELLENDDDDIIEDYGFNSLVAKWKKGFKNIKDSEIIKQQSLTFYLEIIEGKMEESTKDRVKEYLGILEI
jgi:hypothetical protein